MFGAIIEWLKSLFIKKIYVPTPPVKIAEPPASSMGELPTPSLGARGSFKLGVVVGHEKKAPGAKMAAPYNLHEYPFNTEIARLMHEYALKRYGGMVKVDIFFRDGVGIWGAYQNAIKGLCDCVIELHFNAFNGKAFGTETMCSPDSNDVQFAHIVQKAMVQLYKREGKGDRGVLTISKSARGGGNVHSFPGGVNCLVEPFFGDNPTEAKMGMELKKEYAACLVDAAVQWARKVDLIK